MKSVAIIGGGAAGLMAAVGAIDKGVTPLVFERNPQVGKKLIITGKGRSNVSNDCDIENFIKNFPGNGSFLYSALYAFDSKKLRNFLDTIGVSTKVERGGRIFPESDKAKDVVNALLKYLLINGAQIRLKSRVEHLVIDGDKIKGISLQGKTMEFPAVIVATGGMSYPSTGSTGDGYNLAQEASHTIVTPFPSLVPLETKEKWIQDVQGLALKNVEASSFYKGKLLQREFGEMIFTHFGVSGPIILTLSREIAKIIRCDNADITVRINLKPALTFEQLDRRLQRILKENKKKSFKNSIMKLFPKSLLNPMLQLSGINPDKPVHQITKEERQSFALLIQNLTLTVTKTRPYEEAIVTAGGVNVKEIAPSTMASKLIKGLYFAGEVLDIDGYTGGYNLQAAFSTGFLAGRSAAAYTSQ
ncbi:MAG: NAD(P)/FAD-dependent oxidoreductase [Bacillota bacterium]